MPGTSLNLKWEEAPDMLKPLEAAKLMRVGKNRIYEWAAVEGFPKIYTGDRNFVIPKEEFKEWVETKLNGQSSTLANIM